MQVAIASASGPIPSCSSRARARGHRHLAGARGAARALVATALVLACASVARSQSGSQRPVAFGDFEGVPRAWTEVLNGYVYDPATYGPRLIAIDREAGGNLPPAFRMATADAYLRAGNKRAAEAIFEQSLTQNLGYPWDDFANIGMGTIRLTTGDEAGAQAFFAVVAESDQASARALGSLGIGASLSAEGRFAEAQEAFGEAVAISTGDENLRQAARFGNAMALYGAGDFAAAARAFEEMAKADPDGPLGEDARYAVARALLAQGDQEGGANALRELVASCDPKRTAHRAPRALRNLDARAMGRNWLHNYRKTAWGSFETQSKSMYSIGGCALARSTLRAVERKDPAVLGMQPVAARAEDRAPAAPAPAAKERRLPEAAEAAPAAASDSGMTTPLLVAGAVLALLLVAWPVVARRTKAG